MNRSHKTTLAVPVVGQPLPLGVRFYLYSPCSFPVIRCKGLYGEVSRTAPPLLLVWKVFVFSSVLRVPVGEGVVRHVSSPQ